MNHMVVRMVLTVSCDRDMIMNNGKVNYSTFFFVYLVVFWSVIFDDFDIIFGNFSQTYEINDFQGFSRYFRRHLAPAQRAAGGTLTA